jgi:hypothetical protein
MAFSARNFDNIKTGCLGTAMFDGIFQSLSQNPTIMFRVSVLPNWVNLGNYSTAAGTSGTSGTTVGGGNYTWVG